MDDKKSKNDNKQLINIIQAQYSRLSKGQKLIAQYIINNYDKVAFMTASKLGEAVGVSESTVVRFANALGYAGYPKLQEGLQELIKNKSECDLNSEFISTTIDCNYYIEEDLNDLIFGNRKFRKSINNIKNPEFELECQKFFDLIIQKTQEEYIEIRNFLEQRNHTYLTNSMLLDDEDIRTLIEIIKIL